MENRLTPEVIKYLEKIQRQIEEEEKILALLEPNGGNLYNKHPLMVNSGTFWRCKHGTTGHGKDGWEGCSVCALENPEGLHNFHFRGRTDDKE